MSVWLPRRAQAGVAVGLAMAFVALANSAAFADQVRNEEWWLQELHVRQAWESTHGSGVTVAVLGTGVNASQPDLSGSVKTGPDFTNSGRSPGHPFWGITGTAVASLIAGHGHGTGNSDGIMGIAPAARILSVRVTLESNDPLLASPSIATGLPTAIGRGVKYAVKHGASVIDLPLDPATTPGAPGAGGSPAEKSAIAYALAHHVVVVAPAGDNGAGTDAVNYPAAYPGVISVGAFNAGFVKAPFTNHQQYVTLTAPGEGVIAAGGQPGGGTTAGYSVLNSTSAASAMVAGIVALIRAQFPAMTPGQITRTLIHSTRFRPPGGRKDGSGYGTVDAASALMAAARKIEAVRGGGTAGGATPPLPPKLRAAPTHSLSRTLLIDAAIAGGVFLILLVLIFIMRGSQRRRARSARMAEVRAAAQVPVRHPEPAEPAVTPAGFMPAPTGAPGTPGAGPSYTGAFGLPSAATPGPVPSGLGNPSGLPGNPGGLPGNSGLPGGLGAPGAVPNGLAGGGAFSRAFGSAGSTAGGAAGESSPAGGPTAPGRLPSRARAQAPAAFPDSAFPDSAVPDSAVPGGPFPDSPFPDSAFGGATAPPPAAAPADPPPATAGGAHGFGGAARPYGSYRMGTVRRPRVSGSPPWEPASEPDSELPWNQAPAPHTAGPQPLPARGAAGTGAPAWDALAEEVWPGGPGAAGPHPPVESRAEPAVGRAGPGQREQGLALGPGGSEEPSQRDRPIYVWSPDSRVSGEPGGTPAAPRSVPPWATSDPDGAPRQEDRVPPNVPPWEAAGSSGAPWESGTSGGAPWDSTPADGAAPGDKTGGAPWEIAAPAGASWEGMQPGGASPWENTDDMPAIPPGNGTGAHARPLPGLGGATPPGTPGEDTGSSLPGVSPREPAASSLPASPAASEPGSSAPGQAAPFPPRAAPGGKAEPLPRRIPTNRRGAMGSPVPGGGGRTFDAFSTASDSTDTFNALSLHSNRLPLPNESTETFPAVSRGTSDETPEDKP